jgi:hypothetical protein
MWYHTLNAGFRTRISGETDFPCIYGERVGLGRSYVKVDGPLAYDTWCEGIAQGSVLCQRWPQPSDRFHCEWAAGRRRRQ